MAGVISTANCKKRFAPPRITVAVRCLSGPTSDSVTPSVIHVFKSVLVYLSQHAFYLEVWLITQHVALFFCPPRILRAGERS